MKLKAYLALLPLFTVSLAQATTLDTTQSTTFHFSTQVSRTVEKDLMKAVVYSRKTGKNLSAIKKQVSESLNNVLEKAKKATTIDIEADGISNYVNYNNKGKVDGWVAQGNLTLKSKDFDAIAKILEALGDDVAISDIEFSVSPEKMASLEDEMTIEAIKQFQHKATVVQNSLNAKSYQVLDVNLDTPNGENYSHPQPRMYAARMAMAASAEVDSMPLEAGKAKISARASGMVKITE